MIYDIPATLDIEERIAEIPDPKHVLRKLLGAEVRTGEDLPAPEPVSITPVQLRKGLLAAGLTDAVSAAVAAAGDSFVIDWEYSPEFRSDHSSVLAMGAAIGLDANTVRSLFYQWSFL